MPTRYAGHHLFGDGKPRCVGLEATQSAAVTRSAIGIEDGMSDFAGGAGGAVIDFASIHNPRADAGSHEHANEVVAFFAGAEVHLAKRRHLDVVPDLHRNAIVCTERLGYL